MMSSEAQTDQKDCECRQGDLSEQYDGDKSALMILKRVLFAAIFEVIYIGSLNILESQCL